MNALESSTDVEIVVGLKLVLAEERSATAKVLAYLGEVDARRLYLPAACSSLHVYCVRVLGMSEQAAYKRIRVARAARRFPVVLEAVAEGRLHLSGAMVLVPCLDEENAEERVREASGKSRAEIEVLVARWAPRPAVETKIEKLAEQPALPSAAPQAGELSPGIVQPARVEALAPERFALQVTVSGAVREKLERARALLRHQVPSGDVAAVLEKARVSYAPRVLRLWVGGTGGAPRVEGRARSARTRDAREALPPIEDESEASVRNCAVG